MTMQIAASLAAVSQANLCQTIKDLEIAGVDIIHFDIEDGNFVPVMTLGTRMIKDLRPFTTLPFDVHLMMNDPEWLIPDLKEMGADMVSVHYEACAYPRRTIGLISRMGLKAGLAFNPKTQIPPLSQYLPYLSFVLILTTEPEIDNATYLPGVLSKVIDGKKQPGVGTIKWQVDGGFAADNVIDAKNAGADIIVSGRGIFSGDRIYENIKNLRRAVNS